MTTDAPLDVHEFPEAHLHSYIEVSPVVRLASGATSDGLGNPTPFNKDRDRIPPRVGTVQGSDLDCIVREVIMQLSPEQAVGRRMQGARMSGGAA